MRFSLEPTVVVRALVIGAVDALVPRRGQVRTPQSLVDRFVPFIDVGVGKVGVAGHPRVGDPCVHHFQV